MFASAREALPIIGHDLKSIIAVAGERISLGFEASDAVFADYIEAYFFPEQRRVIKPGPLRDVSFQQNLLQITHQQPRRMLADLTDVYGVLVLEDGNGNRAAYDFENPATDANLTTISPLALVANSGSSGFGSGSNSGGSILMYMAAMLLGGIVLNIMPCVFPVLSMKALSFAKNAGESVHRQRMDLSLIHISGPRD